MSYCNIRDINKMDRGLNKVRFGSFKVWVNVARFNRFEERRYMKVDKVNQLKDFDEGNVVKCLLIGVDEKTYSRDKVHDDMLMYWFEGMENKLFRCLLS